MQTIPLINLAIMLLPALLVVWVLGRWSNDVTTPLHALARMIIQLCAIGYALTYIFNTEQALVVASVLAVMLLVSSWIALRSIPHRRKELYGKALLATLSVNLLLLGLATQIVLQAEPWYQANLVIPIAGMIFAVGMNAISLFSERYFAELAAHSNDHAARNAAYTATLIPTINSLFAVGLVSLPGMMTGQILSGVSPLIAVRYQIMIMLLLFASSGLTAALFYRLIRDKVR